MEARALNTIVGIAEMKVSTKQSDVLITYSLGSCVGLTLFDPKVGIGGLIHCMLPLSRIDPAKAKTHPEIFTDTGVPMLIQALMGLGANRERLVAKVAGAASLLDERGVFKIGERNYVVLRKVLWKNNIPIAAEDVGGTISRSMALHVATGKTLIRYGGQEKEL